MQMIVRAFPVLPGKEDAMRALADAVQSTRAAEAAEFYRRIDPDAEPLGPPTTLLFDTEELARRHLAG